MRYILLSMLLMISAVSLGQSTLKGVVVTKDASQNAQPVVGAHIYWLGTSQGEVSDINGEFEITRIEGASKLITSSVGFASDTTVITNERFISIQLKQAVTLKEVEISGNVTSTKIDRLNAIKVEEIGIAELQKAACCNLSESFETSPSVDVSFNDAVTGTRQIQLLGLAGPYTQITTGNVPDVRGLASIYGLNFIPGTWIESIQLNKGTGSVLNGFESIAGQINVELKKPESAEKLFVNLYANQGARVEANAHSGIRLNEHWSTAILAHYKQNFSKLDRNDDNFLDIPLGTTSTLANRWKYAGNNGLRGQLGVKWTSMNIQGGESDFESRAQTPTIWGLETDISRFEAWSKIGLVSTKKPGRSVGLQLKASKYDQLSWYGFRRYMGKQQSGYANLIYQDYLGTTNHVLKSGVSFQYDDYEEQLGDTMFAREERIPGAFIEYAYNFADILNFTAGARVDHHQTFGAFVTPRFHLRWAPTDIHTFRLAIGRGQRFPSLIAENNSLLASGRTIHILGNSSENNLYGLQPEVAWNYGLSYTFDFKLGFREGSLLIDAYRTQFENQLVTDLDRQSDAVYFYNLEGESFSNSFQVQLNYEVIRRLDLKLAYRWFDVQTTFGNELLRKPLIAAHRSFLNLTYETRDRWQFDFTLNWQGEKRLPNTEDKAFAYQLPDYSESFSTMHFQVSKTIRETFDVYLGIENLLNFRQSNPILASENPFSDQFDATLIWGPVFGRMTYAGLRYYIK